MPTASSLLPALSLTLAAGGAASVWLWKVRRTQFERDEGLKLLSAMRWREFSRLVVDGLRRTRGFEPEAAEDALERSQDSVLHLRGEGRDWLLACKQGVSHRITPALVGDMSDAVRFHGAAGGILVTPGAVDGAARRIAGDRIELMDGDALWPLVQPQLAESVREELRLESRELTVRHSIMAWSGALAIGVVAALAMPRGVPEPEPASTPARPATAAAAPATPAPEIASAPVSEYEQRDEVIRLVSTLVGVERAMWSTRSTLVIYLTDETADPVEDVCAVIERFEALRTSRLHLQPPAGSTRPARFLQCRTF